MINDTSQWPPFVQWWHTHWNYYYEKSGISVGHMTEKESRCRLDVKDFRTPILIKRPVKINFP